MFQRENTNSYYAFSSSGQLELQLRLICICFCAAGQAQHAVEEHERADQHGGVPHHASDPAAGTMTAKSKKKRRKNRENGGKGSEANNLYELEIYRTSPLAWASARAIPKALSENATKALTNFYNSGAETAEGAALLPFDPPILWDVLKVTLQTLVLKKFRWVDGWQS